MDIPEWGMVRLNLDDESWWRSILTAPWMMCMTARLKRWFQWKLVQNAFLEWGVCRLILINKFQCCFYKLRWGIYTAVNLRLLKFFGGSVLSCTAMMGSRTHLKQVITIYVRRFGVMCVAAHSNLIKWTKRDIPAVKWGVLHFISEWFSISWIRVRSMDSIRWGVIIAIFQFYKYYIVVFISLGEEVKMHNGFLSSVYSAAYVPMY